MSGALRRVGLGRIAATFARTESVWQQRRVQDRWLRTLAPYLGPRGSRSRVLAIGTEAPVEITVVMCLWRRTGRVPAILSMLDAQLTGRRVRLVLWNNDSTKTAEYHRVLAGWKPTGSISRVELFSSDLNLGGLARFVAVRQLRREGLTGAFITLDDDQDVSPQFVETMLAAYVPGSAAGWWAWFSEGSYWLRRPVEAGAQATYLGTGGAIFDSEIVTQPGFFSELPARYGFLEDIWASEWIMRHGGELRKVDVAIGFVQEEMNQTTGLTDLKDEFVHYLVSTRRT